MGIIKSFNTISFWAMTPVSQKLVSRILLPRKSLITTTKSLSEMVSFFSFHEHHCQRWSRGHKARGQGQGQGHKKNPRPRPRPRTAFPRTDTLEAKDRNARGQGQGPRTQPQVLSKKKKKLFKKFFQAISNLKA